MVTFSFDGNFEILWLCITGFFIQQVNRKGETHLASLTCHLPMSISLRISLWNWPLAALCWVSSAALSPSLKKHGHRITYSEWLEGFMQCILEILLQWSPKVAHNSDKKYEWLSSIHGQWKKDERLDSEKNCL